MMVQSGIADDLILCYMSLWHVFHDSLILLYISNTVQWINIILGLVGWSDTMNDFIVFEVTLTHISMFSDFAGLRSAIGRAPDS